MKRASHAVGLRERREQPLLEDDRHPVQPGVGAAQQNPRNPVDLVVGRRPACLADRRGRLRVLRLFGRRLPSLLSTAASQSRRIVFAAMQGGGAHTGFAHAAGARFGPTGAE